MLKNRRVLITALLLLFCLTAAAGDSLQLRKATVDAGGGIASGGDFVMSATIGQADAGVLRGSRYELKGGFWAASEPDFIFNDSFEEN